MYLITYLLIIFVNFYVYGKETTCPLDYQVISLQDAKDAARASDHIYGWYWQKDLIVGDEIPRTGYRITKIYCAWHTAQHLKAFIAKKDNTTLVAFRGTKSVVQLMHQFGSALLLVGENHNVKFAGRMFKLVEYFLLAFRQVFKGISELIQAKGKHIITGHSLGGALASMVALHLKVKKSKIWDDPGSSLITFGQPRMGGGHFAKYHDQLIPPNRKLRIVYKNDIVSHLPHKRQPDVEDFEHHSREIWLASKKDMGKPTSHRWWHFKSRRVHMKVCKPFDPADCSNTYYFYSMFNHKMSYYIRTLNNLIKPFYNKYGTATDSWEKAFKSSC